MSDGGSPTIGNYEDELSARVLFLVDAAPGVAMQIIDRWQEELWIRSKTLERAREAILRTNHGATPRRLAALPLLLTRRLKHVTADLDFLEALKSAHEQWMAAPNGCREKTRPAPSARGSRRPLRRSGDPPER
jgi:hypothetical protein